MLAAVSRLRVLVVVCVLAAVGGAAALAAAIDDGRIGPDRRLLNSGRHLEPAGRLVALGNFPTGAAATPDGRFYWTVSAGRGPNDVRIVSVNQARVIQTLRLPGGSGGIVMDPRKPIVYVSGTSDSIGRDDEECRTCPGRDGDVIHVFSYSATSGRAVETGTIPVPPPSDAPPPQSFPPTNTKKVAWPDRLAISPDGARLLVPLNLADNAAIVDVASKQVRYVKTGSYPYGAAILRDGKTGLVSNESPGTVSVIDLVNGTKTKDIQVGPHLSHPEAIAVDPHADRAYVAIANSDQVAVIDTKRMAVQRMLSVERPAGIGTSPVDVSATPDGRYLLVAEAGADEIAVFRLPAHTTSKRSSRARVRAERVLAHELARAARHDAGEEEDARAAATHVTGSFAMVGRIPVADYPTDVEATAARRGHNPSRLLWVAAKGLGTGPNLNGPNPLSPLDSDAHINSFQYLPSITLGRAGVLDFPSAARIAKLTPVASRQLRPSNPESPPPGTPLRAGGPIKHVFYIVRENRTYDQVLGDLGRGDSDPKLTIFGQAVTPNAHALATRFPLVDHVYANSEASIDGHFWTAAAKVSDYVNKNWHANYGGRGRPYDFGVYAVTWPANGFLFDQAERQGISYFNYGEAVAGDVPLFPDKDRSPQDATEISRKFAHSDLGPNGCYPNDSSIDKDSITGQEVWDGSPPAGAALGSESRFDCFQRKFTAQVATGTVPAFNYLVLTNDHTVGVSPGERTPRALVADNDYGLGQVVDLISHSSIWKQSAIFVVEDDSQDGADHVDAHRIPALVVSPYARQGAIVHTRYDFLSVIRSMELIVGMKPLGLFDALGTPMYDAFQSKPSNDAPYTAVVPAQSRTEVNPATAANAAMSRGLNFHGLDRVPQRVLDAVLWRSVHGAKAQPPPPGPNASGADR